MAATAFDTLDAARRLKAAGIATEHAEAIVEVMGQSVNQLVTREHYDAVQVQLKARIDVGFAELGGRIDALEAKMWRMHLVSVGALIAAIALATTILGMMLTRSGGM